MSSSKNQKEDWEKNRENFLEHEKNAAVKNIKNNLNSVNI